MDSSSLRTRPPSSGSSRSGLPPPRAATASPVKVLPSTAPSWSSRRSEGASPSRRAAIRAWRVSGTSRSSMAPATRWRSPWRSSRPRSSSIRTVSTAYKGIPSARSRIWRRSPSGSPGTSPASSSSICGAGSGPRGMEVARRRAAQPGWRSYSSGRARTSTYRGWALDQSSRWSMKSSRPASAHWRSSKTSTVTPRWLRRSKNRRQAENRSSRSVAASSSRPSRWARRGRIQRRSSGSATCSSTATASLAMAVAGGSASRISARIRTISASAQ